MRLRQSDLNIVLTDHLQKKGIIQKSKETGDSQYVYQNEVDKACFENNIIFGDFKDLTRRGAPDKILREKAFNIAKYL